ncbi:protein of unknown function [Escherichia coli]|nr:protein of unknown function [Escherichia coli]
MRHIDIYLMKKGYKINTRINKLERKHNSSL